MKEFASPNPHGIIASLTGYSPTVMPLLFTTCSRHTPPPTRQQLGDGDGGSLRFADMVPQRLQKLSIGLLALAARKLPGDLEREVRQRAAAPGLLRRRTIVSD